MNRHERRKATKQWEKTACTANSISIPMVPEVRAALEGQLHLFRAKFGREPGPDDPVFFDPDKDVPTPLRESDLTAEIVASMRSIGIRPELVYAFQKTGRIVTEFNKEYLSPEDIDEYGAAVDEYFEILNGPTQGAA